MSDPRYILLDDRAVLSVTGADRKKFLQGLITNSVEKLAPGHALYSALLTPNGRFLHDFFLTEQGDALLLDTEKSRAVELLKRLSIFKLRADVALEVREDIAVVAALGKTPEGFLIDPRHADMGSRAILPLADAQRISSAPKAEYEAQRLALSLPDGSRDIEVERGFILEYGFEDLHGVDFNKGCYMGQEVVSRTKHTGVLRKFLHKVEAVEGALPAPGTPIMAAEKEAGVLRTHQGNIGLALLRLEFAGTTLTVGNAVVKVALPEWVTVKLGEAR